VTSGMRERGASLRRPPRAQILVSFRRADEVRWTVERRPPWQAGGGQASVEQARRSVKVDAFRDRFPAGNQYDRDFFGRSVPNCLVRNADYQLAPRSLGRGG